MQRHLHLLSFETKNGELSILTKSWHLMTRCRKLSQTDASISLFQGFQVPFYNVFKHRACHLSGSFTLWLVCISVILLRTSNLSQQFSWDYYIEENHFRGKINKILIVLDVPKFAWFEFEYICSYMSSPLLFSNNGYL